MNDETAERQLWTIVKSAADGEPGKTVRLSQLAVNYTALTKDQACQIARSWKNRGLVVIMRGDGTHIALTTDALLVHDPTVIDGEVRS